MTEDSTDASTREAFQYWGHLFNKDRSATELLNNLLSGIYAFISTHYEPNPDCSDVTPAQLAAFYRAVGGDYDILFVKEPPSAIAFIYKSLGCLHSLQPNPDDEGFAAPTIPALKRNGFITWQTIQLLLGPEEHVEFLRNAVSQFDIQDPSTGGTFPKLLPKQSFPEEPDRDMMVWYDNVSEKLRRDVIAEEKASRQDSHSGRQRTPSLSDDSSGDERAGAATYFRDPLYRNREGRPTIVRRFSKNKTPREILQERGRLVAKTVRRVVPWGRRPSPSDKEESRDRDDLDGAVSTADEQRQHIKKDRKSPKSPQSPRSPQSRTPPTRRRESLTSSESDSDVPPATRHRRPAPPLRQRRSHETPASPPDYFPPYNEAPRRYSHVPQHSADLNGPSSGFVPSREPLFATQVAQQMHPQSRRSSAVPIGGRYDGTPQYRYSGQQQQPHDPHQRTPTIVEPPSPHLRDAATASRRGPHRRPSSDDRERYRERERDRDRERTRARSRDDRERPRMHRYVTPVEGVSGRRYPNESSWR